jgi:tripartite ATP-independent transporter DctM subunit
MVAWLPVYGMLALLLLRAPVYVALGAPSLLYLVLMHIPTGIFSQRLLGGVNDSILVAIPMFLLAGRIMNRIGATERIFGFAMSLVGAIRGGLGHVVVLASLMFSAMSGSATADAVGVGTMTVKVMRSKGYPAEFGAAITLMASCLAPIIPPSIVMIIYGSTAGVSIGRMFIAGVLPGLLLAAFLLVAVATISAKRRYPVGEPTSFPRVRAAFKDAFLVLVTPVIIIGGIFSGLFTPTEAAVVAATYVIFLGIVYRQLTWRILCEEIVATGTVVGVLMLVVAVSGVNSWVFSREQIPTLLVQALDPAVIGATTLIFGILLVALILGTFMDGLPIILMMIPVINPLLAQAHIDPVHFGVLFCVICTLGGVTPPVGGALYGIAMVSRLSMERVFWAGMPFFIALLVATAVMTVFPGIITWLPALLMG